MSEDLQSLLEKINRDGVEKAQAQSEAILAQARQKAADIVKEAENSAVSIVASAKKDAENYAQRAAETIAQAGRDTIIETANAITRMLEKLLLNETVASMKQPENVSQLAFDAVKSIAAGGEVATSSELIAALTAKLAALPEFTVEMDETINSGFTVKTDNGRIEHSFTGKTLANELCRRLRPDLAAILRANA
jgi:V/A-type H+-transporting ATPase subunit E